MYRLPLLQDLAAHYASQSATDSDPRAGMGNADGSVGEGFKEGMDQEERERGY